MSLLGTEVITIRVALVCVGALTPVVTYWVGQRTLGRTEGIIAGLAWQCTAHSYSRTAS